MPVNIYRTKLVILGESTVGKTALLQMVISDGREFPKIYNMTLGTDLQSKRIPIINSEDVVELLIYDSTGLDLYTNSLTQFWDQPDMLMIVYDVTSPYTFDSVNNWHKVAMTAEWAPVARSPSAAVLFANKTDLTSRRHVSKEAGQELADKLDMVYFEGSAKENQSVNEAFYWLAQEWHNKTCNQSSAQTNIKPSDAACTTKPSSDLGLQITLLLFLSNGNGNNNLVGFLPHKPKKKEDLSTKLKKWF